MLLPESWPMWLELLLRVVIVLLLITVVVLGLTYGERKFLARMQRRLGPTRTGPMGLLQPIADALKLMLKEDFLPGQSDRAVFWLAPLFVFVPAFLVWVTIPFTRDLVVRNLDLGLFYLVAASGLSIVGILMAGWGSSNKYAVLGAARAAAQLISYELPLVFGLLAIIMVSGTLNLADIVDEQHAIPYILIQPVAGLLFLLASLAEVGRTPFDIPVAESEVMGGPFIEYSGIHWSMFFLAEYANTFAIAALTTLLFLSGWQGPVLPHLLWFVIKMSAVILLIFWIRASIPRFRIDQLMSLAWKLLLPLSFANILLTGFYVFYDWPQWVSSLFNVAMLALAFFVVYRRNRLTIAQRPTVRLVQKGEKVAVPQ